MSSIRSTKQHSTHHSSHHLDPERFRSVTVAEGKALLDKQARKYLGMSGDAFRLAYRAGAINDPDRSEVIRVSLLLPFAEGTENGQKEHS